MKKNNNTKVVILAGGKGTRFNPFSFVIPKPLMPINQNPIILYLVTVSYTHLTLPTNREV